MPAPRESFCRLFINNEYQGVYAITEEIDGDFAQRVTGETDGTMFEYHYVRDWRMDDLGDDRQLQAALRGAHARARGRQHALQPDSGDGPRGQRAGRRGLARAGRAVHRPEPVHGARGDRGVHRRERRDARLCRHEQLLPVPAAGIEEAPGLRRGTRTTHSSVKGSSIATTDANVLFRRAMAHPDLREIYLSTVEQAARRRRHRRVPRRSRSSG